MQVESLVGLPIYLGLWSSVKASERSEKRWRWLIWSGIMAGIVVLYKLMYLPLMLAFWTVYLMTRLVQQRAAIVPTIWQTIGPLAVGLALPLLPVILYWAVTGTLDEAFYTQIQLPPQMMQVLPKKPLGDLLNVIWLMLHRFFPLLLLAIFAIKRMGKGLTLFTTQLLVWLVLGFAVIVAQRLSWFSYHFMLLLVPVSILAALGLDALLTVKQHRFRGIARGIAGLALGGLVVINLVTIKQISGAMHRSAIPLTPAAQLAYQQEVDARYVQMTNALVFLKRPDSLPGDIYVIGDPLLQLLSGRSQAVPLTGWIPELLLPEQWQLLEQQLETAHPNYIFIDHHHAEYVQPQFKQFLNAGYSLAQEIAWGTWYQIRPTAKGASSSLE
jgi:hypothetical protein